MKLPTPEQVRINDPRICTRENRAINWDLVDVFLRVIKDAGGLTLLSDKLCIDRGSLLKRRRELKLKPLPAGRPKVVKLTIEEEAIYNLITTGTAPSVLARRRGTSQGAVSSIYQRAILKKDLIEKQGCQGCGGLGIVACDSCINIGLHHHVCLQCGGNSTTWASAGMK